MTEYEEPPWRVEFHEEIDVVETIYGSEVDGEIALASSAARIAKGKEVGSTNFLINGRAIQIADGSTAAIFERMTQTYHTEHTSQESRFAVVNPTTEEGRWFASFFEDVGVSRGWDVRRFESREDALAWLTA